MIDWIHQLPPAVAAFAICAAFLVPMIAGSCLIQPSVARLFRGERDINTVLGFLLNTFALYFGVLLALLSIAVYENRNKAQDTIEAEAGTIMVLDRHLLAYPQAESAALRADLKAYLDEESGPGWREQAAGRASARAPEILDRLYLRLAAYAPAAGSGDALRHAETLRQFDRFAEVRRKRVDSADSSVPGLVWTVVLIGAAINMVVIWMFDISRTAHGLVGGTLAIFVGLVIYMIAALDAPFRGAHGLAPDALSAVARQIGAR